MRHKFNLLFVLLFVVSPAFAVGEAELQSAASRLGLSGGHYSIAVVSDNRPNAGAYPDGRIIVTSGMLDFVRSESELAAVLAHERAHVDQHHAARQGKEFFLTALLTYGIAKAAGASGDLATGVATTVGVARWQRFSLRDEYRADEGSKKALARAGYESTALEQVFTRLQNQPPVRAEDGESLCFLNIATHPSFDARIKALSKIKTKTEPNAGSQSLSGLTIYIEEINLEGHGYTSPYHVRQLILTELRKHARVFERQTFEVRYKVNLSANIVLGWSGGSRGVFLPDFDIEVSAGRSRAHGSFSGTVVDLQNAEVVGGVTTPRSGTSKTSSGFFVRAGRLSPIAIQTSSSGSMEQILLQRLVEEGVKAWVADLVKQVEPRPPVLPERVQGASPEPEYTFTNIGSQAYVGQTGIVFKDANGNSYYDAGEPTLARVKVTRIVGQTTYLMVTEGQWPGSGFYVQLDQ